MQVGRWLVFGLVLLLANGSPGRADFVININPGANLAANPAALAAFNRAADQWEARITSNATITIDANLAKLGTGILGQAGSTQWYVPYDLLRTALVNDATQPGKSILASLPVTPPSFITPASSTYTFDSSWFIATQANLKVLGIPFTPTASDANITFTTRTGISFDFDNSNGVTSGAYDFETVAAHEIGHALGFVSSVDDIDYYLSNPYPGTPEVNPYVLDLFRFATTTHPTNGAEFASFSRDLTPGVVSNFDDTVNRFRFSTGAYTGDGNQASHWKADDITGSYIGIMDPTLSPGTIGPITEADWRALALIGYDVVAVPEPGSLALTTVVLVGWVLGARRRRVTSASR